MFDGVSLGDWGQIAVGVAALLAAIFYSKRQIDKRRFVHQIKMTPIIQIDGVSSEDIEIKFKGLSVKALSLCSISALNLGNKPILRNDWDESLKISFSSEVQIVDFKIGASNPKDLNLVFALNDKNGFNEIHIQPFLLNSGEGFRIEIVVAGEEIPKVTARIVGISKIEHFGVEGRNLARSFFMVFVLASILGLMTILDAAEIFSRLGVSSATGTFFISLVFGLWLIFFGGRFPTPLHLDEDFHKRPE